MKIQTKIRVILTPEGKFIHKEDIIAYLLEMKPYIPPLQYIVLEELIKQLVTMSIV